MLKILFFCQMYEECELCTSEENKKEYKPGTLNAVLWYSLPRQIFSRNSLKA